MIDQAFHRSDPSKSFEIAEEHGSFLLIRAASAFVVVERRNGQFYPMAPGEREGVPMTADGVAALLDEEGCLPDEEARRLFKQLCERGERLAQCLR